MSFRPARSTLSLCLALSLAFGPVLPVQAQPVGIPSMGAASGAELSPALERTLGNAIMEQGRRSPEYVSDPDINQYLTDMGRKLAQYGPAMAQPVTVFALRDSSINAFALPGDTSAFIAGCLRRRSPSPSWPRCWLTKSPT